MSAAAQPRRSGGCWRYALALMLAAGVVRHARGEAAGEASPVLAPAIIQTQADIHAATEALNTWRERVSAERLPLAQRVETLADEVRILRAQAERLREGRAQGERERRASAEALRAATAEADYVTTALLEYRRAMETRAGPAEADAWHAALAEVDAVLDAGADFVSLAPAAEALLGLAAHWSAARWGGEPFAAACLDTQGREWRGQVVSFGPAVYFVDDSGERGGVVGRRLGSLLPVFHEGLPGFEPAAVRRVAEGAEVVLPVDASAGHALRMETARVSWWAQLRTGGPVMAPIAGVGLLALVLSVWKGLDLRRVRPPAPADLEPLLARLNAGDAAGAQTLAAALGEPLGPILRDGIIHRQASPEMLEELLHERVMGVLPRLDRHLGLLAVLGGVAPLLGLLGTVTGMIHTFQLVTLFGTGDARLLSGGIAEALVTTKAGLVIAIPVALIHAYFARRVRTILGGLEQTVLAFVNRIKGLNPPPAAGSHGTS